MTLCEKNRRQEAEENRVFFPYSKRMTKSRGMITSWNAKEIAAAANWLVYIGRFQRDCDIYFPRVEKFSKPFVFIPK